MCQTLHNFFKEVYKIGTSLAKVHWLRLHTPSAGDLGSIPRQGTRSHMLQLKKDPQCCN